MKSKIYSDFQGEATDQVSGINERFLKNKIQCPGLTPGAKEIERLAKDLPRRLGVLIYKKQNPCIWVVFVGGTGTGKSTLFNAFCKRDLSKTGVERPKTCGPILYVNEDCTIEKGYPFDSVQIKRHSSKDSDSLPSSGIPGHLLLIEHGKKEWSDLVVADTPDLDSVEAENREIAEDLSLLSDATVFVTSQEKYADELPYKLLLKTVKYKTPYFLVVNKVQDNLTRQEVLSTLETQEIKFRKDRIWLIPRAPSQPLALIAEHPDFKNFVNCFSREFLPDDLASAREADHSRRTEQLILCIEELMSLVERENKEALKWLEKLDSLSQSVSQELIQEQKARFTNQSKEMLSRQIRSLFDKYDLLARPRRFVTELILIPFRFIGFKKKDGLKVHRQALLKIREQFDTAPMLRAIEKFNRLVLEKLSPSSEDSALFWKLRDPDMLLNHDDINRHIREEQDLLITWLEERFQDLAKGIPRGKKWGIYSTSVLWGILILSFQTAMGGGFTVLHAVLNSVLAPLVTKGAMEMFAYHEIQKIARELGERYQQGLISAVHAQRKRYEQGLRSLITPVESLNALNQSLI
jgi:GTPase SAR1 family protein